jgi:hypothetical protein
MQRDKDKYRTVKKYILKITAKRRSLFVTAPNYRYTSVAEFCAARKYLYNFFT